MQVCVIPQSNEKINLRFIYVTVKYFANTHAIKLYFVEDSLIKEHSLPCYYYVVLHALTLLWSLNCRKLRLRAITKCGNRLPAF